MNSMQILETRTFGPFSRYRVEKIRDRFGSLSWFVFDAEVIDAEVTDGPAVIRQFDTEAEFSAFETEVVEGGSK